MGPRHRPVAGCLCGWNGLGYGRGGGGGATEVSGGLAGGAEVVVRVVDGGDVGRLDGGGGKRAKNRRSRGGSDCASLKYS